MDIEEPGWRDREEESVVREIYVAFEGVTREGGISWSEAQVEDDYGTEEELRLARESDRESGWQELVNDPEWEPNFGFEWCYLDPIGSRYYLPAAMIRSLSEDEWPEFAYHIQVSKVWSRERLTEKWSALDLRQRHAVARFLRYMGKEASISLYPRGSSAWTDALQNFWEPLPPLES